jgi:hypothetical protein
VHGSPRQSSGFFPGSGDGLETVVAASPTGTTPMNDTSHQPVVSLTTWDASGKHSVAYATSG